MAQYDYYNFASGNVTVTSTAETVAVATKAISTAFAGQSLFVQCGFQITIGAGMTTMVVKIERGSVAGGTAIYTSGALTVVAAQVILVTYAATDQQAGDQAGQPYVCTVTMAGGAGNSTVANAWSTVTVG